MQGVSHLQTQIAQAAQLQQQAMLTSFPLGHDDYVHDISFDFYGKRVATCSSDQHIRVWEKRGKDTNGQDGWELTNDIQAHEAAVQKVKWADPEFGAVLASSSYDKQVYIWEEESTAAASAAQQPNKKWTKRFNFLQKETVLDIKFAPKHWGLMLSIALQNGTVKVFVAKDLNNLTQWYEDAEVKTTSVTGVNCLSWNPAFDEP